MMSPSNSECPALTLLRLSGKEDEHDADNCFCCSEVEVAWTAPQGSYPEYVNFKHNSEMVEVTVREPPKTFEGVFVCANKSAAGRCAPGDNNCNNYCNMAPEKGPMQPHPKKCTHVEMGKQVTISIPAVEFYKMVKRWL